MARFSIDFNGTVDLETDEIWPDGDAPDNPTLSDVLRVMRKHDRHRLLSDWSLLDEINIVVADNKTGEHEPL